MKWHLKKKKDKLIKPEELLGGGWKSSFLTWYHSADKPPEGSTIQVSVPQTTSKVLIVALLYM